MAATKALSGARIVANLNGKTLVWGNNVSYGEEIAFEPADVLDYFEVKEWVPTGYRANLSAGLFRTVGSEEGEGSLKKQGFMPQNSGTPNKILLADAMDMVLLERVNNVPVIQLEGVRLSSYNISVTPRGLLGTDVQFVCIRAKDESEL